MTALPAGMLVRSASWTKMAGLASKGDRKMKKLHVDRDNRKAAIQHYSRLQWWQKTSIYAQNLKGGQYLLLVDCLLCNCAPLSQDGSVGLYPASGHSRRR